MCDTNTYYDGGQISDPEPAFSCDSCGADVFAVEHNDEKPESRCGQCGEAHCEDCLNDDLCPACFVKANPATPAVYRKNHRITIVERITPPVFAQFRRRAEAMAFASTLENEIEAASAA